MSPRQAAKPSGEHYVFVAHSLGRWFLRVFLFVSVVTALLGGAWSALQRDPVVAIVAGAAFVFTVLTWALMQTETPQRITVDNAVIQIRRDGHSHTFDLEDPGVDVRVRDGEIAFAQHQDRWVVVRSRDVDWKVFSDVVMRYQTTADKNAEERDKRFSK